MEGLFLNLKGIAEETMLTIQTNQIILKSLTNQVYKLEKEVKKSRLLVMSSTKKILISIACSTLVISCIVLFSVYK